jgi:4-amino-4-deoxy-L-arabinose transferase-like glycosyltransferase
MKLKLETIILIAILLLAAMVRLPSLDQFPAGLNADEAAIGYNAYSLIQTGKDEHGASWPLVFRSFDDYKPPLYFYMVLPFVAAMGLNVWAVRLPSALLGIAAVYLIYLLSNRLFPDKLKLGRSSFGVGLVSALILALNPWHIHFSRGGWEVNAATTLVLAGFVWAYSKPRRYWLAGLAIVASLYTYHALRLILPFLLLGYFWLDRERLLAKNQIKAWLPAVIVAAVLLIPLAGQFFSAEGSARFTGVSVFADEGPLWEALALRDEHELAATSPQMRLLHNKYISYTLRIGQNYLSHFSPRFLYIQGDEIERSRIPGVGLALLIGLPFFALGTIASVSKFKKNHRFVLLWLLLAPLAAAITFQSPHALRAQNMVIPLTILTATGFAVAWQAIRSDKVKVLFASGLLLLLAYESGRFLHYYFLHYPQEHPVAWEYGFQQLAEYIKDNEANYERIIISDRYDQPYIIMAFFLEYPPEKFQNEIVLEPRDRFGFSTVRKFGKFEFRPVDYFDDTAQSTLVVAINEGAPVEPIKTINFPNGQAAFRLYAGSEVQ